MDKPDKLWRKTLDAVNNKYEDRNSARRSNYNRNGKSSYYSNIYPDNQHLNLMDYLEDQGFDFVKGQGNTYQVAENSGLGANGSDYSSLVINLTESRNKSNPHTEAFWTRYSQPNLQYKIPPLNAFIIHEYNETHPDQKSFTNREDQRWADQQRVDWIKRHYAEHHSYESNYEVDTAAANAKAKRGTSRGKTNRKARELHPDLDIKYNDYTSAERDANDVNNRAYKFLTEKRGLDGEMVMDFMNKDLIRGYAPNSFKTKEGKEINEEQMVSFPFKLPGDEPGSPAVGNDTIPLDENGNKKGSKLKANGLSDFGFNFQTGSGKQKLYVFESSIDALSFYSQNRNNPDVDTDNASFLSLSGSGTKIRTIENFEKIMFKNASTDEPHKFQEVNLALDSDAVGRKSMLEAVEQVRNKDKYVKAAENNKGEFGTVAYGDTNRYKMMIPKLKDWNDISQAENLQHKELGKTQFQMNVDDYSAQVVKHEMKGMQPESRQAFERIAYDYAIISQKNEYGKKLSNNDPAVKDIRKTLNGINQDDAQHIKNFMNEGGGSFINGGDLQRYAEKANIELKNPSNFLTPKFQREVGQYEIKNTAKAEIDGILSSMETDTGRKGFLMAARMWKTIEKSKNAPDNKELEADAEVSKHALKDTLQKVRDSSPNDIKTIAKYIGNRTANKESTNIDTDIANSKEFLKKSNLSLDVKDFLSKDTLKDIKKNIDAQKSSHIQQGVTHDSQKVTQERNTYFKLHQQIPYEQSAPVIDTTYANNRPRLSNDRHNMDEDLGLNGGKSQGVNRTYQIKIPNLTNTPNNGAGPNWGSNQGPRNQGPHR